MFPFVCLHRESAAEEPEVLDSLVKTKQLTFHREFYGHRILVGSKHFRKALVDSSYFDEQKMDCF